ncbi:DEAD/DEAH box helicase [bacterium]|jgi:ATP-dependent DNA helicase RecQ|nr:DEAD/DEAH box helicase [bacterium]
MTPPTPTVELRPFQAKAIQRLTTPGHLICVSPTGSGKSLIFHRLAEQARQRTILVSPLVALARQHHEQLTRSGISAELYTGGDRNFPSAQTRVWILSPESLRLPRVQAKARDWKPSLLVVDECHCYWEWGTQFRPAFLELPKYIQKFSIPKSLWLTATLPSAARKELQGSLSNQLEEMGAFDLPENLTVDFQRVPFAKRTEKLVQWLEAHSSCGILFVATREDTHRLARVVEAVGRPTVCYHGGMSREERVAIESWIENPKRREPGRVVIATTAFGLGMDFPSLEWVCLWQAPLSLLNLAQALGRVARNGRSGEAVVFWDSEDFKLLEWAASTPGGERELKRVKEVLAASECRIQLLQRYFDSDLCS